MISFKKLSVPGLLFLIISLSLASQAIAFVGPTTGQSPGSGGGKFNVDSAGNIGFGTASPTPVSTFNPSSTESGSSGFGYVFIVASTTNPGVGLKNITSGNTYIWSSRNFGNLQLYRESGSLPGYVVMDINQYGDVAIGQKATSTGGVARLFVGGNVQTTGSFVGSLSGSLSSANVSSDVFGRLQGNGNFAFPASLGIATSSQNGLPQELSVYGDGYFSGNIGIGTMSPGENLHVYDSGTVSNDIMRLESGADNIDEYVGLNFKTAVGGAGPHAAIRVYNGPSANDVHLSLLTTTDGSTLTRGLTQDHIGSVGIGTSTPQHKLVVSGGDIYVDGGELIFSDAGSANRDYVIYNDSPFLTSGGSFTFQADTSLGGTTSTPTAGISVKDAYFSGNVGIGTQNPTAKLHVVGNLTVSATTTISGNWQLAGASLGSLNMGAQSFSDITGVDKLTVTTIDPLYNIGGKKYATYVSSIAGGVKEEFIGKAKLSSRKEYVLDFDAVEEGSDLWVWRKAVDFSKDNIDAFVTPYGGAANIYYEVIGNKIIFHSDRQVEFSYRLIGKRFDWAEHPTFAKDQNEDTRLIIR